MDLSGFKKFGEVKPDTDYEVLEFDGQIDDEGQFIDLKDGTYPFSVKSVSKEVKTTRTGQEVPVVNVILSINGGEQGITPLKHTFWLTKKNMWNISDFFISIGVMKSGEKGFRMHWTICSARKDLPNLTTVNTTRKMVPKEPFLM